MTNVVIRQNSRKLLMMGILMSETCSAHKKWNKIASEIMLVFYSSSIKWVWLLAKADSSSPPQTGLEVARLQIKQATGIFTQE